MTLLKQIASCFRGKEDCIGLYAQDLRTGEELRINADRQFRSASLIKNAILWTFYRRIADGTLQRNGRYLLQDADKVGETPFDTGILRDLHSGIALTMLDIAAMMIAVSDDTATNILIDQLGQEQISEEIRALGLKQTALQRRMMEYEKARCGIDNLTSAADMAALYQRMLTGNGIPPALGLEMLDLLSRQRDTRGFPSMLPEQVRIAHKTGTIRSFGLEHDVGVIYAPDGTPALILCVLTEHLDDSLHRMALAAKLAYESLLPSGSL